MGVSTYFRLVIRDGRLEYVRCTRAEYLAILAPTQGPRP